MKVEMNVKMKEQFINPKMSLAEVRNLLAKTMFSAENIEQIKTEVKQDHRNTLQYRRKYLCWLEGCKNKPFCFLDQVADKGKYPIRLVGTLYYSRDSTQINFMFHAVVQYREHRLVTALINNNIEFFTQHSINRYEERFLGRFQPVWNMRTIGEMLINNNMSWESGYKINGTEYKYVVVRDGIFICTNVQGIWLRKTFISHDMFRLGQKQFYNNQLPD